MLQFFFFFDHAHEKFGNVILGLTVICRDQSLDLRILCSTYSIFEKEETPCIVAYTIQVLCNHGAPSSSASSRCLDHSS